MRTETHYNTPEQVAEYLTQAVEIVEALDPPADLRPLAFGKACDWLQGKHIEIAQPRVGFAGMPMPRGV